MAFIARFSSFVAGSLRLATRGSAVYWGWIAVLLLLLASGVGAYLHQWNEGLAVTAMRDQVSWGDRKSVV